jgi:hypothetical protein
MQRLEVSGAVRLLQWPFGVNGIILTAGQWPFQRVNVICDDLDSFTLILHFWSHLSMLDMCP